MECIYIIKVIKHGKITYQFELIQAIRKFFEKENFTDVITPPLVENPGMETHIHPFQVFTTIKETTTKDTFKHLPNLP